MDDSHTLMKEKLNSNLQVWTTILEGLQWALSGLSKGLHKVRATHIENLKNDLFKFLFWMAQTEKKLEVTDFQEQLISFMHKNQLQRHAFHEVFNDKERASIYLSCVLDMTEAYYKQDNTKVLMAQLIGQRNAGKLRLLTALGKSNALTITQLIDDSTVGLKESTIYEHLTLFKTLGLVSSLKSTYTITVKGESLLSLLVEGNYIEGLEREDELNNLRSEHDTLLKQYQEKVSTVLRLEKKVLDLENNNNSLLVEANQGVGNV